MRVSKFCLCCAGIEVDTLLPNTLKSRGNPIGGEGETPKEGKPENVPDNASGNRSITARMFLEASWTANKSSHSDRYQITQIQPRVSLPPPMV